MRVGNLIFGTILVYVVVLMSGCEYNPNLDHRKYPELTGKTHYTCFGDGTYKSEDWYHLRRALPWKMPNTGDRSQWPVEAHELIRKWQQEGYPR